MSTIITKPKVEIAPDILHSLSELTQEEGQVIVHCVSAAPASMDFYIRIWPTTYLFDKDSPHQSELVHVEKISIAPMWQLVPAGTTCHYSLIFSGLPKNCTSFNLEEIIPLPGRFTAKDIRRNDSDVYFVRM